MSESLAPGITRLADLKPGERGIFFALLFERNRITTSKSITFFNCKFRDLKRTVSCAIWPEGPHYTACEGWTIGKFFKVHATFSEHERYGPQIDVHQIRPVELRDSTDGFNPADFGEHSRFDPSEMFSELGTRAESLS